MLLGATGTIGRATARALVRQGHQVVCLVRPGRVGVDIPGAQVRPCDVTDAASLAREGFRGERFDVLVSCLASRTGALADAWAIDHDAHVCALEAAKQAGVTHMVLLSAICVQKPLLAFQRAKLAFEEKLAASGLTWSIVRPTAFFKSLSGQIERVRQGKPFLVFGDGTLTACKPVSDDDLGDFIAGCIGDTSRHDRILPQLEATQAITPRQQEVLFCLVEGKPTKKICTELGISEGTAKVHISAIFRALRVRNRTQATLVALYYATESMLVLDPVTGRYDPAATPSTGRETLFDFYERIVKQGERAPGLGDHAVF